MAHKFGQKLCTGEPPHTYEQIHRLGDQPPAEGGGGVAQTMPYVGVIRLHSP